MLFEMIYNIVVMPIEIAISFLFEFLKAITCNVGITIILLSIVMQLLLLLFEDKKKVLFEEECVSKFSTKHVAHIRKIIKYGVVPLYVEVPLFIAIYFFFVYAVDLSNSQFLFIKNLGVPDGLLSLGVLNINIIPILNFLSDIGKLFFVKNDKTNKAYSIIHAFFFVWVLYNSPAGLVLYWLFSNFFLLLVLFMKETKFFIKYKEKSNLVDNEYKKGTVEYYINKIEISNIDYFTIALLFTLFWGGVIPLGIIMSSPMEFVSYNYGPVFLVLSALCSLAGVFFVWGRIIYNNINRMSQKIMLIVLNGIACTSLVNYFFFGDEKGEVNSLLISSDYGTHSKTLTKNAYVCYLIFIVATLAYIFIKKYMDILLKYFVICSFLVGIIYSGIVSKELSGFDRTSLEINSTISPIIPISKTGKNIVVVMLDRAISNYLPYILEEKEELIDSFDGFIYYPNTISFGGFTNFATPALFGGYEYTPDEMNKRDQELLVDKHDEALLVLPELFGSENFKVTVCDPPYAGYDWIPDLKIYKNTPNTNAYITEGRYLESSESNKELAGIEYKNVLKHNFIFYPLVKTQPLFLQSFLNPLSGTLIRNISADNSLFARCFSVLQHLEQLTRLDEEGNTLLLLQNSTTHDPIQLDLPGYTLPDGTIGFEERKGLQPKIEINGVEVKFDNEEQLAHYQTNVVVYIELAKWFDFLKEEGVYDNTRIIIVSDHGRDLKQFDDLKLSEDIDVQKYNALLMIKDFNSTGFTTSDEFMTVADVATYATKDVIDNPINPFTGKHIDNSEKYAHPQIITTSDEFGTSSKRTTFNTAGSKWFSVQNNIFDVNNWEELEK